MAEESRSMDDLAFYIDAYTRELVANLLRVMAGAGRPYSLAADVFRLAVALSDYEMAFQARPVDDRSPSVERLVPEPLCGLLDADQHRARLARYETEGRFFNPEHLRWEGDKSYAIDSIQTGILRILASRLLGQLPQERSGEEYLFRGCRELEAYFDARGKRIAR